MGGKTAVIIMHGIGEQVPMDTIKGFVVAVWTTDPSLTRKGKPAPDGGSFQRQNNASCVIRETFRMICPVGPFRVISRNHPQG